MSVLDDIINNGFIIFCIGVFIFILITGDWQKFDNKN